MRQTTQKHHFYQVQHFTNYINHGWQQLHGITHYFVGVVEKKKQLTQVLSLDVTSLMLKAVYRRVL